MNQPVQVELTIHLPEIAILFRSMNAKLDAILRKEIAMDNTIKDTLAAVQEEKTVADSIVALTDGLKTKLDEFLAGKLNAEQQAQVNEMFDSVQAQKQQIADAILRDTPQDPTAAGGAGATNIPGVTQP